MANSSYITFTSSGVRSINLNRFQSPFNVSLAVSGSSSGTFTYAIEYTLDDQPYLTSIGSTITPVWFPDANLATGSSNGTTNYMFPVAAVRCTVSALSSANVIFRVLQGGF